MIIPWVRYSSSLDQYCIQPLIEETTMYHELYMIGSCIIEHRSHYSFEIVTSMGLPSLSILYMSHIICISPIEWNHINTKTKIHHAPAQKAPPLHRKSYDVHWTYNELLPSHIRGQYVNSKNPSLSSTWPTPPKDTHAWPSFHPIIPPHPQKGLRMSKRD